MRRELLQLRGRPALARARPVRLRPGAHPRGRLQHALEARPKARHLAAARYFEALGDDELAGVLAGHYLAAYRPPRKAPRPSAVAVQARLALRGAAERAAALGSHDQVFAFLDQALSVTTEEKARGELAELLEASGAAIAELGRYEEAHQRLDAAIAAQRELGDRPATIRTIAASADLTPLIGEYRTVEAEAVIIDAAIS